ncbi:putative ABC transporter ATP-binding protein YfiL [Sporosarcina sp. NCCP-2222]|uniref:ABC transporter ATP-binding protein n=1 Tax=Sporosarcina sp. NCCP-2222 TaxID=2935073 RepID=UPI0020838F08|nr:ABC transporter ATP-binding protein [Sporosarcina sp. NCCP-2222]GKV57838.1 putative ABC transporter ATP-binding protein YfiL [Sporosarcina sp. NCCP-2222]
MLTMTNVKKRFGEQEVVKGITLHVGKGEAFGLLGPNGAGKSTTISMICGLVPYDEGDIQVDGLSVSRSPYEIKKKIGVVPQDIALYPTLSALDNLVFWGKMYGLKGREAKARALEVLETVGLVERGKDRIETFSGGMKRRINIGAALLHRPELLIMDEPTVGIDPQSRHHILETVKRLNEQGMTIIYTSHYMEEVEFLCKRIAIMDHGQVIATGSTQELCKRLAGGNQLLLDVEEVRPAFVEKLKQLDGVEKVMIPEASEIHLYIKQDQDMMASIVSMAAKEAVKLRQIKLKEADLETLFLQMTGRSLRD